MSDRPNNPDSTRVAKRLRGTEARRVEMLSAFQNDLRFADDCCQQLLDDHAGALQRTGLPPPGQTHSVEMSKKDQMLVRLPWDAALVALFKWYGTDEPNDMIKEALDADPDLENSFEDWKRIRDHRITHPVGADESVAVGVFLPDSENDQWGLLIRENRVLRGTSEMQVRALQDFVQLLLSEVESRRESAMNELLDRATATDIHQLRRLPDVEPDPRPEQGRPFGAGAARP